MFKSKTTFIVGAGASCEANLPSGDALKVLISRALDIRFEDGLRQISGDYDIFGSFQRIAEEQNLKDINKILEKAWRIRDVVPAAAISIDNFLDAHRGDSLIELCGKIAIVKSILSAERGSKLRSRERGSNDFHLGSLGDSWYVKFFQILTEGVRRDDVNSIFDNVSIITFNYDRCIERFVVQSLREYYNLNNDEAERIASKLDIFHPYGAVGPLPWQDARGGVAFGADRVDLLSVAMKIKTFTEGLHDEGMLPRIRGAIQSAETLVFLGFAFHPMNMSILTPNVDVETRRVFATTLGMSDADEVEIEKDIFGMLRKSMRKIGNRRFLDLHMSKSTCYELFNKYSRSMKSVR